MREPPSHVNRSSSFKRPPTPSHTRRPCSKHSRVRVTQRASASAQAGGDTAGGKIVDRRTDAVIHLARHVEPSRAPVAAEVLPEVRELQRRAQRVRRRLQTRVTIPADPQHEPPDRIGGPATVVEEIGPRVVPSGRGILRERAQQIVEELERQVEFAHRVAERDEDEIVPALVDGDPRSAGGLMEALLPRAQARAPHVRCITPFVGDVVRDAGERIDRSHVGTHGRGKQARRHGKVLVMIRRERRARLVGTIERAAYHSVSGWPAR